MSLLQLVRQVRKKLISSISSFVPLMKNCLIYFVTSYFEDKSLVEYGQTPHQMKPVDASPSQCSTVAVSDDVKGALSQKSRIRNEVVVDDDLDSKRRYVNELATSNFLSTSRYLS